MTKIGSTVWHAYEYADLVELAYLETEGEVTEDTEHAEELARLANDDALRALSGFLRHCEAGKAAIEVERNRLAEAEERIARADAWARSALLGLLGDRKKATAGTFRISTVKGRERVDVVDGFDAHEHDGKPWAIRYAAVTTPGGVKLDKREALKALKAGTEIAGLTLTRGDTKIKVA